jgi:hypothetical protein
MRVFAPKSCASASSATPAKWTNSLNCNRFDLLRLFLRFRQISLSIAYLRRFDFLRSIHKVTLACDVVAVKHAPRLVAGDFHANHFRYPGADHVTHGRAPEVVKEQAGQSAARVILSQVPRKSATGFSSLSPRGCRVPRILASTAGRD